MLEAKYYRDYGHNYLILQCRQHAAAGSYQYKILTSGKIGEILSCSVRYINGCTYYYYDISSRTTLDSMYRGKKMTYAQVKDVLCQIRGIYERLAGYFMEERSLVLQPEHIYYDITDGKYIGLYYPDYKPAENACEALMSFLLEHIDTDDRNLAEKMYSICEMSEKDCFFIEDMIRILEENEGLDDEILQEPIWEAVREPAAVGTGDFDYAETFDETNENGKNRRKRNLFYPVFAGLSALGIAGAIAVYNFYELTQREETVVYGLAAAMGMCLFFCVAGIFRDSRRSNNLENEPVTKEGNENHPELDNEAYMRSGEIKVGSYIADANIPSLDKVISRDMDLETAGLVPVAGRTVRDKTGMSRNVRPYQEHSSDGYGDTVFFDGSAANEYKLYATDKKNKNHIELKQFPCTIGKMAGCVDYVLSDNSISRIHARLDREGEKVMLTDMNSTNGTYKNGLRMQPRETVELEPGDEVRFGNLNYCYR